MLNIDILKVAFPAARELLLNQYINHFINVTRIYNIESSHNIAMFLAQVGYESNDLRETQENLNHSSGALLKVFRKYFLTKQIADQYSRNPEAIANRMYANRMGNGDEESGDGWTYRGKGLIKLKGKDNYIEFATAMQMNYAAAYLPLEDVHSYLETPEGGCTYSAYFWYKNKMNDLDLVTNTSRIDSDCHGLVDRQARFERIIKVL